MKTTSEWCFGTSISSCAIVLDSWQQSNCRMCQKARFYNEKTGKMPKYRCAIQEQIESQAGGIEQAVNVRTFDAVHGQQECKFISRVECDPDVSHKQVIDAHEFAKGERVEIPVEINDVVETMEQAVDVLEQVDKLANMDKDTFAQKMMESIKGDIDEMMSNKDLTDAEIQARATAAAHKFAKQIGIDDLTAKMEEIAARFKHDGIIPGMTESQFKQKMRDDVKQISEAFTFEEHKRIAYVPLVLQHVAWDYAIRARRLAADYRISETKKLCRAVDEIHRQFIDTLAKDLDKVHRDRLLNAAKEWMNDTGNDQTILYLQVQQAYLTQRPNAGYRDIRSLAMCAILLAEWIFDYQKAIDIMVAERLHTELTNIPWPHLKGMVELMNGFVQDETITRNQQIDTCMRVMTNRIERIKWIE